MKQGYLYIVIATIMFSTFEVALKYIAGEINSVQLTFARFFIGFLFLAPLAWRTLKKRGLVSGPEERGLFRPAGPGGHRHLHAHLPAVGELHRLRRGGGAVSAATPVFVTFLAFLFLGEAIRGRHIAALVLEVLGTVAIINPFETRLNPFGVVLALAATILFAIYGVMGKEKSGPVRGLGGHLLRIPVRQSDHLGVHRRHPHPGGGPGHHRGGTARLRQHPPGCRIHPGKPARGAVCVRWAWRAWASALLHGHGVPAGQRGLPGLLLQASPVPGAGRALHGEEIP